MGGMNRLGMAFSQWRMMAENFGSFPTDGSKNGLILRWSVRPLPPAQPTIFHNFASDVFGSDDGGIVIGDGENQFVAQIEHENIRVAFIE